MLSQHLLKKEGQTMLDMLGAQLKQREKIVGRNCVNLIASWCRRFLFFVVPGQFSQDIMLSLILLQLSLIAGMVVLEVAESSAR